MDARERNRLSWNAALSAHESHRADQAAFFRGGGTTLFPEERELLGELAGRSLAHLMCNAGQDTLSLALLGAQVTGVDFSDEAIAAAGRLAEASGVAAHFEQAEIYAWLDEARRRGRRFDRVYCGYGAICWLPDILAWARGIAALLHPQGRFALIEFHPTSNMFDSEWRLARPYPAGGAPLELPGVGDYVGDSQGGLTPMGFAEGQRGFVNPYPCTLYRWGVGEVLSALAEAGLAIRTLREYCFVNGERPFARMRPAPGRRWLPPEDVPAIPLMYGLVAEPIADNR